VEAEPVSVKTYWGSRRVFRAYNTDYLAQGIAKSQNVFFEAYNLTTFDKITAIYNKVSRVIHRLSTVLGIDKMPKKH